MKKGMDLIKGIYEHYKTGVLSECDSEYFSATLEWRQSWEDEEPALKKKKSFSVTPVLGRGVLDTEGYLELIG